MTTLASPVCDPRAFAARQLPRIEAGLARALGGMDPALGGLATAARQAAGVGGGGGRRWRPLLTLAGVRAAGLEPAAAIDAAVAVELTHTASLVLDDLPCMDDSSTRRGVAATHRTVGPSGAILVALGLLARSVELLAAVPRGGAGLCRAWSRAIGLAGMSGGQGVDLAARQGTPLRGAPRRLYRQKTTALAAFALGAGARAAGAPPRTCLALEHYGRDLGWAYQLADDAADEAEDRAGGRASRPIAPLRQAARLLGRAERRLAGTPALEPDGVELLLGFGRAIVPAE